MCGVVTMVKDLGMSHTLSGAIKKGYFGKNLCKAFSAFILWVFCRQACLCTHGLYAIMLEAQKNVESLGLGLLEVLCVSV